MSRIKELKALPENNMNVIDMLATVCPEGKTKYIETLYRLVKKSNNLSNFVTEAKKEMVTKYNMRMEALDEMADFQVIFLFRFFDSMFEVEDVATYQKFCEYNERGLIPNNDLTTYKAFKEIEEATSIASLKVEDKEMEAQIVKLFEDKEWLIIRPLTYRSSRKYGSNTKWCTTQENNPEYFRKYSTNGILIYCMNKITGFKVAFYTELNGGDDFGFWSQTDQKVDSLLAGLPMHILELIQKEVTNNRVTNRFLLSDEQKMKEEAANIKMGLKSPKSALAEMPMDVAAERPARHDYGEELMSKMVEVDEDGDEYASDEAPSQMQQIVQSRNKERAARERVMRGEDAMEEKIAKSPDWFESDQQAGDMDMVKGSYTKSASLSDVIEKLQAPLEVEKYLENISSENQTQASSNMGVRRG